MAMFSRDSATTRRRQSESFRSSSWNGAARCVEELAVGGPERNLTSRLPPQGDYSPRSLAPQSACNRRLALRSLPPLQPRGSTSPSPHRSSVRSTYSRKCERGPTLQTPPAFPGAGDRTRTDDLLITSELLYH